MFGDSQNIAIGNMAAMLGEFKTACMENGFTEEEALQLTIAWMQVIAKGE